MKNFTATTALGLALALTVLTTLVAGCARHNQAPSESATVGASMQTAGVMSQSDYVRIRDLGHSVSQTHTISDSDLNFTLGFLKSADNSVARARALTTLSEIRPMSTAQKSQITPAITPYLNSADKLDQAGAQRVQKAMQASN